MMKWILKFYSSNKLLSKVTAGASVIIILYEWSRDLPEWFVNADHWFLLAYQFSMAIVGSCIFYIIQSYIPQERRNNRIRKFINEEYTDIFYTGRNIFLILSRIYLGKEKEIYEWTEADIEYVASNMAFDDKVISECDILENRTIGSIIVKGQQTLQEKAQSTMNNYLEALSDEEVTILYKFANGKMERLVRQDGFPMDIATLKGDIFHTKEDALLEMKNLLMQILTQTENDILQCNRIICSESGSL